MTDPILAPEDLRAAGRVLLVDARSGPDARERFEKQHLAGAQYVDLDRELARRTNDPSHGGRHPLPEGPAFSFVLARLGVALGSQVVVYDDANGSNAAARFWWMVRAAGHANVRVLDGGFAAALAAGVPTESGPPRETESATLRPALLDGSTASIDEVAEAAADPKHLVIDVRDPARYRGEREPIDPVAGHVPGAINVPFATNLDANGRFLPAETLRAKYLELLGGRPPTATIVHCGSGVTACHTLLAMDRAGLRGARLWVGSWGEWCRTDRPIARGDS